LKVVNIRKESYDIYIGRGSIFGNPFAIGEDGNRKEVLEKYEFYVRNKIKNDTEFREELMKLDGKTLGCFCKPLDCHGDILIKLIEELKGDKNEQC
jgi:hypothetical protein